MPCLKPFKDGGITLNRNINWSRPLVWQVNVIWDAHISYQAAWPVVLVLLLIPASC